MQCTGVLLLTTLRYIHYVLTCSTMYRGSDCTLRSWSTFISYPTVMLCIRVLHLTTLRYVHSYVTTCNAMYRDTAPSTRVLLGFVQRLLNTVNYYTSVRCMYILSLSVSFSAVLFLQVEDLWSSWEGSREIATNGSRDIDWSYGLEPVVHGHLKECVYSLHNINMWSSNFHWHQNPTITLINRFI